MGDELIFISNVFIDSVFDVDEKIDVLIDVDKLDKIIVNVEDVNVDK